MLRCPQLMKSRKDPDPLVLGIDYTVENGLYVFTAHYLARRGYCCRSGCRNCPYGFSGGVSAQLPPEGARE